jgi:CDP-diacylglycerol--serine O-phosphatidyltransferase
MATQSQWFMEMNFYVGDWTSFKQTRLILLPFIGLLIPLASAYRLAKFNIDERQTSSFIGMPTPAFALFVVSLPLILHYSNSEFFIDLIGNKYVLITITVVGSFLLNAELPLFSLKFKDYSFKNNMIKYIFLIMTVLMVFLLKTVSIPLIIILYILLSIVNNSMNRTQKAN